MNLLKFINVTNIKIPLTAFLIVGFIFLSGLKFDYFQFRYLILILLFPCIYKFYTDFRNRNYYFLISFLLLLFFLSSHIGLNIYFEKSQLTNYSLFGVIFLLSIFPVSYYYSDFINQNINLIIKLFIIIFLISCAYSLVNYRSDAPFYCGGISISHFISSAAIEQYGARVKDIRLSFREFIFPENSHLGMIAPSIIIYSVYRFTTNKTSRVEIFFLLLFLTICLIKSSTTFLFGTFLSLNLIILFNYKLLNKKTLISYVILILMTFSILVSNRECRQRFVPVYNFNYLKSDPVSVETKKKHVVGEINVDLAYKIQEILSAKGNLSSAAVYRGFSIAKKSIIEKPLGWGLNRYDQAFNYFNEIDPSTYDELNRLNNKDGTNNFNKLIVEFGIFGLIFYLFIFLFFINKKISLELKLFYFPFILTQSMRGAGYFNGGFSLIFFIILFTLVKIYKQPK